MLKIDNLYVAVGGSEILGDRPRDRCRRSARDHGAERLGKEHAGPRSRREGRLRRHRRTGPLPEGDLLALAPEERAAHGVFLAFQYPVEIPGVPPAPFSAKL